MLLPRGVIEQPPRRMISETRSTISQSAKAVLSQDGQSYLIAAIALEVTLGVYLLWWLF